MWGGVQVIQTGFTWLNPPFDVRWENCEVDGVGHMQIVRPCFCACGPPISMSSP